MKDNDLNMRPWSGPFGMGGWGDLILAFIIILAPLILALVIVAVTGQLPAHAAPHFH